MKVLIISLLLVASLACIEGIRNGEPWLEAPYMARIQYSTPAGQGGGVIFSQRHILTSGFVVNPTFTAFTAWVGSTSRGSQRMVAVQTRLRHPNYQLTPRLNDIGIVTLTADLVFDDFVWPIRLPIMNQILPYDNQQGTALGFGGVPGGVQPSEQLQAAFLRISPPTACNTRFPQHTIAQQFCGEDSRLRSEVCNDDLGGPFIVLDRGREVLVGLISDHFCIAAQPSQPALFTRVSAFRAWINQMTLV
ncbi:CLUMA_CG003812, isoform A [Clunio marinus]|uniref:CLUMA_CG003812, isoform A n=1 Tax=Clunio marinus TaxID=568069 RepID=A0A1J1HUB9_9DIPT|nr:CLUMA_CG003812, isoform A [Clunio marinus]